MARSKGQSTHERDAEARNESNVCVQDMCVDMCIDVGIDVCVDRCLGMCAGMCEDMWLHV